MSGRPLYSQVQRIQRTRLETGGCVRAPWLDQLLAHVLRTGQRGGKTVADARPGRFPAYFFPIQLLDRALSMGRARCWEPNTFGNTCSPKDRLLPWDSFRDKPPSPPECSPRPTRRALRNAA